MTWQTVVADKEELRVVLDTIRTAGGTITGSCPCPAGFLITFVTTGD